MVQNQERAKMFFRFMSEGLHRRGDLGKDGVALAWEFAFDEKWFPDPQRWNGKKAEAEAWLNRVLADHQAEVAARASGVLTGTATVTPAAGEPPLQQEPEMNGREVLVEDQAELAEEEADGGATFYLAAGGGYAKRGENSLNHWVAQAVAFLRAEDAPRGRLFLDLFALCGDFEGLLLVRKETLTWWTADVSNAWLDAVVDEKCSGRVEVAILDHSMRARGGGRDYVVEDRHFNARTVHLLLQRLPRDDALRLFDRLTQKSSGDGNRAPPVPSSSLHSHFVRDTTSLTAPEERELLFAWNVVLKRCVADLPWKAMDLLCGIVFKNPPERERLISPDSYTFTAAFDLCARHGRSLFQHHDVAFMKSGVKVVVSTQEQLARALLVEAVRVPDGRPLPLQERKVVNACVGAFQCWETALLLYQELFRHEGLRVADRCRAGETFFGKAGSSPYRIARSGSLYERFLAWKKHLGPSDEFRDPRPAPDAVSHTAVLATLARNGRKNEAVRVLECIAPDAMDPRVRAAGLRCFDPEEIVALLHYLLHRGDPASSANAKKEDERSCYNDYDSLPPTLQKLTRIFDRAFAVSKAEHRQGRRTRNERGKAE
eukprot:g17730.t1